VLPRYELGDWDIWPIIFGKTVSLSLTTIAYIVFGDKRYSVDIVISHQLGGYELKLLPLRVPEVKSSSTGTPPLVALIPTVIAPVGLLIANSARNTEDTVCGVLPTVKVAASQVVDSKLVLLLYNSWFFHSVGEA
jgi:hypothetical protein